MRPRGLCGLALACFVLLTCSVRSEAGADSKEVEPPTPFKPAVLVRVKALEDLIADARYLVKQAGREEEAKQVEKMLKARTGPKGLEGIDTKKPIGLYGSVAARVDRSEAVLLLPIADEATFLKFLDSLDLKPEKDKTGLYTLTVENSPFPVLFRFANGYLYGTVKFSDAVTLPAKDKLPLPAAVLAGGGGVLSVTANIDRIPLEIRKLGVSASALTLGNMKEEKPEGETPAAEALRGAILDEAAARVKSLLLDGGAATLKIDVDRKSHDLSLSFTLDAKNGSALAKSFAAVGKEKSVAAALAGKAAMGGFLHLALPASVRKVLGPAVDEAMRKGLDNLEKDHRELLAPLADAFKATAKAGTLDLGLTLRGPGKLGKYTLVGSFQVADGENIEKAARKVLDKLPDEAKKPFKIDVAKAEGVAIHRVEQEKMAPQAKELFGEGPLYFAVRKDAVIFTTGEKALETLKEALAVEPKAGKALQLEMSLGRIANLLAQQNKAAPEAAKKAFTEKGSDKVRLSVAAGGKLEVKLNVKSAVLTFAGLMDKARKEAEKEQ
jgi:hypothetical protein